MSKLFVITFKRPALDIEKKTMNIETAYDCEATGIPQVNDIRLRDAQNKYEDVNAFECEESDYIDFVSNDDAYLHFVKTGEHTMTAIQEEVEVGTDSHTETIPLVLTMVRNNDTSDFGYDVTVDTLGQIVIIPKDVDVHFTSIKRGEVGVVETLDGNVLTLPLTITANMISDSDDENHFDDFEWFTGIDEIGQAVITPTDESTSFLTASVENSLNLVTPVNEDIEVGTDEYQTRKEIVIATIADLEAALETAIKKAKRIEADFQAIGIHNADIDSYMISYLENFIEDREGEVSCAEFMRRIEEYEDGESDMNEAVNENKIDKMDIINKFMRGELPLFSDDGEPDSRLIRLDELDTHDKIKHEYYYDPESESIIYYEGK